MSTVQSADFQRFVTSLDAQAMSASQAFEFDEAALKALGPAERTSVEALIATRLDSGDENPRLVEAAATIGSPGMFEALRRRLAVPSMTAITAAYRLWVLQRDASAVTALVAFARTAPAPSWRQAAAALLKEIPGTEVDNGLVACLDDADRSVRSTAYENLVVRFHLNDYRLAGGPLFHLAFSLLSGFVTIRQAAQVALRTLFAGLARGETPEQHGLVAGTPVLSPALLRFRDSLGIFRPAPKDGSTFDLAALDQILESEREYAADLLIGRLDAQFLRAPEGLAKLGVPNARAALQDASQSLPTGAMLDAVHAALGTLGQDATP